MNKTVNTENIMVIPDIHGRNFWKSCIDKVKDHMIIFLGDYIDPYPYNMDIFESSEYKILQENSIENLKDIIQFKKDNIDNVVLLLGNHDCSYMYDQNICRSRHDYKNHEEISKLFKENKHLFQLAYTTYIDNNIILFSHAGVHKLWIEDICNKLNKDIPFEHNVSSFLNELYYKQPSNVMVNILKQIPWSRGGYDSVGSCIWTDLYDWDDELYSEYNCKQIFGHTQLNNTGNIVCQENKYYCVDSRKIFELTEILSK